MFSSAWVKISAFSSYSPSPCLLPVPLSFSRSTSKTLRRSPCRGVLHLLVVDCATQICERWAPLRFPFLLRLHLLLWICFSLALPFVRLCSCEVIDHGVRDLPHARYHLFAVAWSAGSWVVFLDWVNLD